VDTYLVDRIKCKKGFHFHIIIGKAISLTFYPFPFLNNEFECEGPLYCFKSLFYIMGTNILGFNSFFEIFSCVSSLGEESVSSLLLLKPERLYVFRNLAPLDVHIGLGHSI